MRPLTSVEFVGIQRVFSSEGEWCRGMLLQRTGGSAELHLDAWGRMVKSFCVPLVGTWQAFISFLICVVMLFVGQFFFL